MLKFLQLFGIPEWFPDDGLGAPVSYPLGARVRYDAGTGFTQVAKVDLSSDLSSWNLRGLFIGDNFYVVSESSVTVISLVNYEVLTKIKIA